MKENFPPMRYRIPLTDADVNAEACDECGQPAGQPCVYIPLKGVDPAFVHYRSAKVQARHALTGTPTKRPHARRYDRAHDRAFTRAMKEWRKANEHEIVPATAARLAAARAEREFERREHEQMRAWLAAHAGILIRITRPGDA